MKRNPKLPKKNEHNELTKAYKYIKKDTKKSAK